MPLITSQTFSEISFTIYVNAAERLLQVKLWKLKIWNKDAITKEIIVALNWFIHIKVFIVEAFMWNKVFLSAILSLSFLRRFSNYVTYVTIICVTQFKPKFQKYKARKCNTFCQCKSWKTNTFGKLIFSYIS